MTLPWQLRRNLESSMKEFLFNEAIGVTLFAKGADNSIDVRVGKSPQ